MTHIGRFEASAGAEGTLRKLKVAREQMEYTFPNDERREIPQVKAVFDAIDTAIEAASKLGLIFVGSGSQSVADFIPDETGTSVNDRQMEERDKNQWPW